MLLPAANLEAEKTRRCQSEPLHGVNCFRAHLVFCTIVSVQKRPPPQRVQLELADANTVTSSGHVLVFITFLLEWCTEPE